MTLEEAIKHCEEVAKEQDKLFKQYDDASKYSRSYNKDIVSANAKKCLECFECAKEHRQLAEWLKELKAYKEQGEDYISRNVAIVQLSHNKIGDNDCDVIIQKDIETIKALPPVTPQPKTGRWINGNSICPCCGEDKFKDLDADIWSDWKPKYCPNCGAKMAESEEKE